MVAAAVVIALLVAGGSDENGRPAASATSSTDVAGNGSGPGQVTPSGSKLSQSEQLLVDLFDPFALRRCVSAAAATPTAVPTPAGVDAAVVCDADGVRRVRVSHYVDDAALDADANRRAATILDVGSCRQGEDSVEDWGRSNRRLGTFMCWTVNGQAGVFWTADEQRLGFEVSGDDSTLDAAALVAWWDDLDPLR